jgi:hypothetical protein
MATTETTTSLVVEDLTGQVRRKVKGVDKRATVGDLVSTLVRELKLPANDAQGRPLSYAARANGASLVESDRIGDVLPEEGTVVTLTQNVTAG